MFVDRRGQKLIGNQGPAKNPFTRVDSTTNKPITEGHFRSYTSLLHAGGTGMGVIPPLPYERTSSHDDARLPVMEKRATRYPKPLDADRFLYLQIKTGKGLPW